MCLKITQFIERQKPQHMSLFLLVILDRQQLTLYFALWSILPWQAEKFTPEQLETILGWIWMHRAGVYAGFVDDSSVCFIVWTWYLNQVWGFIFFVYMNRHSITWICVSQCFCYIFPTNQGSLSIVRVLRLPNWLLVKSWSGVVLVDMVVFTVFIVCYGERMKNERKKIQKDIVLNEGVKFYSLGTGNSEHL